MDTTSRHKVMRALGVVSVLLIGTATLAGCRDDEQSRLINYQPGVYKGKPDTPISDKARADAKVRVFLQAGAVGMAGGGAKPDGSDVRRPGEPSNLDHNSLKNRLRSQGG